jgi:hypothetical protein
MEQALPQYDDGAAVPTGRTARLLRFGGHFVIKAERISLM